MNNLFLTSTQLVTAQDTYQIATDIKVDFTSPLGAKNGRFKASQVDTVVMHLANQIEFSVSAVVVVQADMLA